MLGLRRQQFADERYRPGLGHRQYEHLAGLRLRDGGVHHEIVVLAAADGSRRTSRARAWKHLNEIDAYDRGSRGRLVDRRGPELRQLDVGVAHRASTTCGVTRWNASA
jgi:hypothetical protein